jgi:transposase
MASKCLKIRKTKGGHMFQQQYSTFKPFDFDLFAGLDVSKKSISATFLTHDGASKSLTFPYFSSNLIAFANKHYVNKRIAFVYEAGPTGFGLYDDLTAAGFFCMVVGPAQTPQAASDRVKTNRRDSLKLALALRGGQLRCIHIPSAQYRKLRHLVQTREVYVRLAAASKLRIKGMFLLEGIPFPARTARSQWPKLVLQQLACMPLDPILKFKLDLHLSQINLAANNVKSTTLEILRFCQNDPMLSLYMNLLQTIPGIGPVVAFHLLARIGDPAFLSNKKQIAALLGLVPIEDSTGDRTVRGSITRLGDPTARNKLIECAWTSIQRDPELRKFYDRIRSRHPLHLGARKAIVAVARKLTVYIFVVLKKQQPYRFASGDNPTLNRIPEQPQVVRAGKRDS